MLKQTNRRKERDFSHNWDDIKRTLYLLTAKTVCFGI